MPGQANHDALRQAAHLRSVQARGGYEGPVAFIYADHPARFSEATEVLVVATVRELVPAKFLTPYHHRQEIGRAHV